MKNIHKMDVNRFLIFDYQDELVKLSVSKIKGERLIIYGKNISDIEKFNPKTVLCYQNEDVVYECKKRKINCIHLYQFRKHYEPKHENVCNFLISRFNLSRIERDECNNTYNFTMIDGASSVIAETMLQFSSGNHCLSNPGSVSTSEIMDYYKTDKDIKEMKNGENRCNRSSHPMKLKNINTYFTNSSIDKSVNIYLPTYHRLEKTKTSLESIIRDVQLSKYDVKIYIGDNSPNFPEMRQWLKTLENENVIVHLGDKNLGKSGMVNHLYKNSRKCRYLFSLDSDMVVEEGTNFVDNMLFHLTRLENCGMVSSNQLECSQHWIGKTVEVINKNGMNVGYSEDGVGIAGGCVCLRSADWEKIGMYREGHDIYTGDDGILTYNIKKILGKYVYISMDCSLIHPFPGEEEKDYTQWKGESWRRDQLQFLKDGFKGQNRKGFFD